VSAEAQARRYLALFPAWLRPTRGEEAVGLVLDLLPPDAEHLPWRSRFDLVRAGLHARRVGTPPISVVLTALNARQVHAQPVPGAWRPWLAAWLTSRRWRAAYLFTVGILVSVPLLLAVGFAAVVTGGLDFTLVSSILSSAVPVILLAVSFSAAMASEPWRTAAARASGIDLATGGLRVPSDEVALAPPAMPNVPLAPVLAWGAAGAAALATVAGAFVVLGANVARPAAPVPAAAFGALLAASIGGPLVLVLRRRLGAVADLPPPPLSGRAIEERTWERRARRRGWWLMAAVVGVGLWWLSSMGWMAVGLVASAACLLAASALLVRSAERRRGRRVRTWEVVPSLGPRRVWVGVADLPPPPSSTSSGGPTLA
jgi:hypothetical protein